MFDLLSSRINVRKEQYFEGLPALTHRILFVNVGAHRLETLRAKLSPAHCANQKDFCL